MINDEFLFSDNIIPQLHTFFGGKIVTEEYLEELKQQQKQNILIYKIEYSEAYDELYPYDANYSLLDKRPYVEQLAEMFEAQNLFKSEDEKYLDNYRKIFNDIRIVWEAALNESGFSDFHRKLFNQKTRKILETIANEYLIVPYIKAITEGVPLEDIAPELAQKYS